MYKILDVFFNILMLLFDDVKDCFVLIDFFIILLLSIVKCECGFLIMN